MGDKMTTKDEILEEYMTKLDAWLDQQYRDWTCGTQQGIAMGVEFRRFKSLLDKLIYESKKEGALGVMGFCVKEENKEDATT